MKILFIAKYIDYIDPMGIELLSALAKREGHETFLYVLSAGKLMARIKEIQPDIIAYSAKTGEHKHYLSANLAIKEGFPDVFTIMGGPHPTFFPQAVGQGDLDAVCIGEGDLAWPEFLRQFPDDIENIDNIYTKTAYTAGKKWQIRSKNDNLDSLPFLDRDLVYGQAPMIRRFPLRSYMTGRGCPNVCAYCFNQKYNEIYRGKGRICNRHSVDRVCAELKELKEKYPTQIIKFYDDVFVFREDEWFNEFVEKYPQAVGLPFSLLTRADYLTESMVVKLKKAGLASISMSIEAGNDEVRNLILGRNMSRQSIFDAFLLCHKHRIPTFANTILAVPGTKLDDDIESLDVNLSAKVTFGEFPIFFPYPQTRLGDYAVKQGYFDGDYEKLHFSYQSESPLNCFTKQEKLQQNNLSMLGTVILVFPRLRNLAVNYLIKLPLTKLYFLGYYLTKAYLNKAKIYPVRISLLDLAKNFFYSLELEFNKRSKAKKRGDWV